MAASAALSGAGKFELEGAVAGKPNRKSVAAKRKKSAAEDAEAPEVHQPGSLCSTDLERQETLLYAQRTVWVNLQQIIESAIRQSLNQNYTAAKFLCEFAGVFAAAEDETPPAAEIVPTSGPEAMRMLLARAAQDREQNR